MRQVLYNNFVGPLVKMTTYSVGLYAFAKLGGAELLARTISGFIEPLIHHGSEGIITGGAKGLGEAMRSQGFKDAVHELVKSIGEVWSTGLDASGDAIADMRDGFAKMGEAMGENIFAAGAPSLGGFTRIFHAISQNISFTLITTWMPTMLAGVAVTVGSPLILRYLYHRAIHLIGRPRLMIESRTVSPFTPVMNLFYKVGQVFRTADLGKSAFFNAEVTRRTDEIIKATHNIQKHGGYFQHLILHGPGGTGKTLIASKIAREAGMNYVMMSGGDLAQYIKRGEHVSELNKILQYANSAWYPTILFIDEAEALCKNRDNLDQEHTELLDAFLKQTGEASKKMMIILATNRLDDIDPAVLSRMDHKIHVAAPKYAQRTAILKQYLDRQFKKDDRERFFTEGQIGSIASKTRGLTGRALEKLVNAIYCKKATTDDNKLTQHLINDSIYDFVTQERDLPGAERSWFFVERICDLWYFTIPAITNYCREIISAIGAIVSGQQSKMNGALADRIRELGYADWFGIPPKIEKSRWALW